MTPRLRSADPIPMDRIQETLRRKLSESAFQGQVIRLARMGGWMHYHTYRSLKSPTGFPDLVLVRERVIYAELKRQTGRVTAEQQAWLEALRTAGQEVYLWRPSDSERIQELLLTEAPRG